MSDMPPDARFAPPHPPAAQPSDGAAVPAPATRSSFAIDVDPALLARARRGERPALEQLYRAFEQPVFTLALRLLGGPSAREDAADVLQDTMLKAFRGLDAFRDDGAPFWGWLRRIAVNEALMKLRARRADGVAVALEDEPMLEDHAPPPPAAADAAQLQRALAALPALTRSVLWLYHAEGYTHEEIAALMQRSVSFSKSQLARGGRRLRALLETHAENAHA